MSTGTPTLLYCCPTFCIRLDPRASLFSSFLHFLLLPSGLFSPSQHSRPELFILRIEFHHRLSCFSLASSTTPCFQTSTSPLFVPLIYIEPCTVAVAVVVTCQPVLLPFLLVAASIPPVFVSVFAECLMVSGCSSPAPLILFFLFLLSILFVILFHLVLFPIASPFILDLCHFIISSVPS